VADRLGIPFYVWDLSEAFQERVVDDFVAEYASGRTPNPCIRCNERVKYTALLARARAVGFDALATGHHARVRHEDGRWHLLRAADPAKDQTYVLYVARQAQLAHTLFPAGEHAKADLRAMAADRGLVTASKPDSHDICFIPSGDLGSFLRPRLGERAGELVGPGGAVVGRHDGAYRFTVGQRRGLGVAGRAEPVYVTAIDGDTVHVGPRDALEVHTVRARDVSWVGDRPPASARLTAQIRYRATPLPARIEHDGTDLVVTFPDERPAGVAPGQAVVLYGGEDCLGGGTITATTA
jgi:tRNA-specific 2-thiouridylase